MLKNAEEGTFFSASEIELIVKYGLFLLFLYSFNGIIETL